MCRGPYSVHPGKAQCQLSAVPIKRTRPNFHESLRKESEKHPNELGTPFWCEKNVERPENVWEYILEAVDWNRQCIPFVNPQTRLWYKNVHITVDSCFIPPVLNWNQLHWFSVFERVYNPYLWGFCEVRLIGIWLRILTWMLKIKNCDVLQRESLNGRMNSFRNQYIIFPL